VGTSRRASRDQGGRAQNASVAFQRGQADLFRGRREITVAGLELWLSERVRELTEDRQHPTSSKPNTIRDITVARLQ